MFFPQQKRKISLSVICFLSLVVLPGCTSKSNRFGIIFLSDNGVASASDIYQIPDSTQDKIEQLTFTPTIGEYDLLVSKDGDKVIFEAGPTKLTAEPSELAMEDLRHIYLLDTARKKSVDMTDTFSAQPFGMFTIPVDLSPDQKQFAVLTYGGNPGTMDSDGANRKLLSISSLGEIPNIKETKWSPDGKKLLLLRGNAPDTPELPGQALLIYDLGSGKIRQLADYQTNCFEATWSSTSQQVAATCANILPYTEIPGPNTIRILGTENPGQPYEHLSLSSCQYPSWSPDGKQIAFACDKGTDEMGLFVINSDGNGLQEVKLGNPGSPAFLRYPTWSPDGNQIIYTAGTDYQHTNIYCVNFDGTNNHPLTHQAADYQELSVYPMPGR